MHMREASFRRFELDPSPEKPGLPASEKPCPRPCAPIEPRKIGVESGSPRHNVSNGNNAEDEAKKELRSPLDSRLRRQENQCYSPATASIVSAAQGLDEESLMILADLVTFVCRAQGGRAGMQRRCAVADSPRTIEHVGAWLAVQHDLLGTDIAAGLSLNLRRSSSCPQEHRGNPFEGMMLKGYRVKAIKDIKSKKAVVVEAGTHGTVNHTNDEKVNVSFDMRVDNGKRPINVKPDAIVKVTDEQDAAYQNDLKAKMLQSYQAKEESHV